MDFVHITSSANPRYKHARALLSRRGRKKYAQLLLEGVRLIEDAMSAGYPPALLFFEPDAGAHVQSLVARAQMAGTQAISMESALLAGLTDTVSSQGVVAVAPWPEIPPGDGGLSVLLEHLRNPGNLGTLLRSAAAAGVDQVVMLPGVTDPWAPKVLRAGMGAHFRVAIRQARDLTQAEAWLGDAKRYRADANASRLYTEVDWRGPSVLIVGGETEAARETASWSDVQKVAIPMQNGVESLNAAVAASIILFEAAHQRTT
ncbi:MAG TPA: RNA methyltransferase [Caldilineae bacterium]|nr:RNA methyltransferase [Caldilineae bacterium]